VEAGWRPYTVGHWEWTDAGWYWVSDEPWAWACYHYGSWVYDPNYGWVWIPGTEWAPAWVTWRESDDYVGWAPCGPGGVALSPTWFVFTDFGHFHNRFRPSSLIVNNTTIINRTRVIGSVSRETRTIDGASRRVAYNAGPRVDRVQAATGTRFTQVPVREAIRQTPIPTEVRQKFEQRNPEGINRDGVTRQPDRTGREQERIYQQPQTREQQNREIQTREQQNRDQQLREQQNRQQQQLREEQKREQQNREQQSRQQQLREQPRVSQPEPNRAPITEPQRTPAPTGRDQQRIYPDAQTRPAPVERPAPPVQRAQPAPVEKSAPAAPQARPAEPQVDRPVTPPGRERVQERQQNEPPAAARPPVPQAPPAATPKGPPPDGEKGRGHDKDKDN
jgi:hypothetical protein